MPRVPDRHAFLECPHCARVFHDPTLKLVTLLEPCPGCGSSGEPRGIWPHNGLFHLDIVDDFLPPLEEIAEGVYSQTQMPGDWAGIATVFLSASLEAILQQVVRSILVRFDTAPRVCNALLTRSRQRERLLRLYQELVGRSAKHVLQETHGELGAWYDSWSQLAENRNRLGHGQSVVATQDVLENVRRQAILAMSVLQNAGVDAADNERSTRTGAARGN